MLAKNSEYPEREMSRRDLFRMMVPKTSLMKGTVVALDKDRCSACALCARECPSEAIVASGDTGVRISFRGALCDGCGVCAEICPEKCIQLSQVGEVRESNVVLFQDEFARCEKCGSVIGSKAMIERVRARLQTGAGSLGARIQLCPVCKGRSS